VIPQDLNFFLAVPFFRAYTVCPYVISLYPTLLRTPPSPGTDKKVIGFPSSSIFCHWSATLNPTCINQTSPPRELMFPSRLDSPLIGLWWKSSPSSSSSQGRESSWNHAVFPFVLSISSAYSLVLMTSRCFPVLLMADLSLGSHGTPRPNFWNFFGSASFRCASIFFVKSIAQSTNRVLIVSSSCVLEAPSPSLLPCPWEGLFTPCART